MAVRRVSRPVVPKRHFAEQEEIVVTPEEVAEKEAFEKQIAINREKRIQEYRAWRRDKRRIAYAPVRLTETQRAKRNAVKIEKKQRRWLRKHRAKKKAFLKHYMSTWKDFERRVAKVLGGKRVPLSGSNSGHDTSGDVLWGREQSAYKRVYVESKHRLDLFTAYIKYYDLLIKQKKFVAFKINDEDTTLVMFDGSCMDEYFGKPVQVILLDRLHYSLQTCGVKPGRSKVVNLWKNTREKATAEGRFPVVCFNCPKRRGLFIVLDVNNLQEFFDRVHMSLLKVEKRKQSKKPDELQRHVREVAEKRDRNRERWRKQYAAKKAASGVAGSGLDDGGRSPEGENP